MCLHCDGWCICLILALADQFNTVYVKPEMYSLSTKDKDKQGKWAAGNMIRIFFLYMYLRGNTH